MNVLGISALYHDSAAALVCDGRVVAAASEERFTRKKADPSIPVNAIKFCMEKGEKVDCIVYYDNPLLTLDRWLENCIAVSPGNETVIQRSFQNIYSSRLWIHELVKNLEGGILKDVDKFYVCEHHMSHAASAFYPSPFEEAAILTMDGVGEWATTTIGHGKGRQIQILEQISYPHSLGLLYSAFTYFCGFKVNFGEYKLMGLAPYGEPIYADLIREELVDIREDGSFRLNLEYFTFMDKEVMVGEKFEELFGVGRRMPEERITKKYMDLAASIQEVTEEIVLKMAVHARETTGCHNLVMAGGIALNCVANGKLLKENVFDGIWIQPAASDAGGALGAALYATYHLSEDERVVRQGDSQSGSYLGPEYSPDEIEAFLQQNGYVYHKYNEENLYEQIATYLVSDKVVGLLDGRMEFGPRALGGRSIIANPMSEEMQTKLNLKIKYRESFRPFAPAVLKERVGDYFELDTESPYMLLVAPVKEELRTDTVREIQGEDIDMLDIIKKKRSEIPAVTHVDYSARVQTVDEERNPFFYKVIRAFEKKTGCGVVVNTSFNVRGEPIVCTPSDAYLCFMRTEMDVLVMENCILLKEEQDALKDDEDWREHYELD